MLDILMADLNILLFKHQGNTFQLVICYRENTY
jgi:hypothetical protein